MNPIAAGIDFANTAIIIPTIAQINFSRPSSAPFAPPVINWNPAIRIKITDKAIMNAKTQLTMFSMIAIRPAAVPTASRGTFTGASGAPATTKGKATTERRENKTTNANFCLIVCLFYE